jgi:N-acetylmuramoyl-L-alanine amidase
LRSEDEVLSAQEPPLEAPHLLLESRPRVVGIHQHARQHEDGVLRVDRVQAVIARFIDVESLHGAQRIPEARGSHERRGGILPGVRESRTRVVLLGLLVALSWIVPGPAQPPAEPNPAAPQTAPSFPPPPAEEPSPGQVLAVPVVVTEQGPLVSVNAVAQRLGGRFQRSIGPSWQLDLEDQRVVLAPGSTAITLGTDIERLSQAPVLQDDEVYAPLGFFERTYGRLLGYRFDWDATRQQVVLQTPESRELSVGVNVIHLQGVTTVVLQFPEEPRYEVRDRFGRIEVALKDARVASSSQRRERVDEPLLNAVDVQGDRIVLELATGADASSYTLNRPFRLVFDVHQGGLAEDDPQAGDEEPGEDDAPSDAFRRPRPRPGIRTIVLDPGHGGGETGAIGPGGNQEKDLTLALARAVKSRLESRLPVRVVLTRDGDDQVPLDSRTAIANQNKADLFVSIHLNSTTGASARGAETYFLSLQASDARAADSAAAENLPGRAPAGGDDDPLYDLQLILWDLAQSRHLTESQAVARLIQEELNGALGLRDRGVKQAPFRVLMGAAMPAVLVELGFLSNPEEEQRLGDPEYRGQLADALVRAISRYRTQEEERRTARENRDDASTGAAPGPAGDAAQ